MNRKIQSGIIRSSFQSWAGMGQMAADFANQIPPQDLISIAHSDDQGFLLTVCRYVERNALRANLGRAG